MTEFADRADDHSSANSATARATRLSQLARVKTRDSPSNTPARWLRVGPGQERGWHKKGECERERGTDRASKSGRNVVGSRGAETAKRLRERLASYQPPTTTVNSCHLPLAPSSWRWLLLPPMPPPPRKPYHGSEPACVRRSPCALTNLVWLGRGPGIRLVCRRVLQNSDDSSHLFAYLRLFAAVFLLGAGLRLYL